VMVYPPKDGHPSSTNRAQCTVTSFMRRTTLATTPSRQPGTERVQALADISRSALCCHSNETRASIAYLPNSAQLGGTPYRSPSYIRVRAVVWACGEGQTHTDTQTAVSTIQFASSTTHAKCNNTMWLQVTHRRIGHYWQWCNKWSE